MEALFVHSALPVGGAEVLRKVVLSEMQTREIGVRVCLIEGGGDIASDLQSNGISVDVLGRKKSIYDPFTFLALAGYLKKHKPTIVQSSQFNSNFHARIAARIAGVPVVICEEHGIYWWKKWWHRWCDRALSKWCDSIISVSEAVKNFNMEEIGIPPDKITVMYNCLDTERSELKNTKSYVRRKLGIEQSAFVVGHVGTFRWEKAHDVLIKAFSTISNIGSCKLLLVGNGPLESELRKQAQACGVVDDVLFVGQRQDVPDLLNAMDIFAFPSRNEALGIALIEAMYSGLPVIATRVGGIPEIVRDGKTGVLVPSEDAQALASAITRLADDPEERNRLGTAARQYVIQHHDPESYVDRLLELYGELLKKKGAA